MIRAARQFLNVFNTAQTAVAALPNMYDTCWIIAFKALKTPRPRS
jgi:hypothetical protein